MYSQLAHVYDYADDGEPEVTSPGPKSVSTEGPSI
jgi:hypothetical protein